METKLVKQLYIDQEETSYLSEPYLAKIMAIIPDIEVLLQERWGFMENKKVCILIINIQEFIWIIPYLFL